MTPPVNYKELALILTAGILQPITEILAGEKVAAFYNVIAATVILLFLLCRVRKEGRTIWKKWGVRFNNFASVLPIYIAFGIVGAILLYVYGWYAETLPVPVSFWYLVALYPVWGFAQQFALQNMVAKNLVGISPNIFARSFLTALCFSAAHIPSVELAVLTFIFGFFATIIYSKYPNLFALGIVHGIVGALVFTLVLGQNQWEILVVYFGY